MLVRTLAQLALAVRSRRLALGLSQKTLAERAEVSRLWVNEFEGGKSTAEVGLLLRVLDALGLDLEVVEREVDRVPNETSQNAAERIDLDDVLEDYGRP